MLILLTPEHQNDPKINKWSVPFVSKDHSRKTTRRSLLTKACLQKTAHKRLLTKDFSKKTAHKRLWRFNEKQQPAPISARTVEDPLNV